MREPLQWIKTIMEGERNFNHICESATNCISHQKDVFLSPTFKPVLRMAFVFMMELLTVTKNAPDV